MIKTQHRIVHRDEQYKFENLFRDQMLKRIELAVMEDFFSNYYFAFHRW